MLEALYDMLTLDCFMFREEAKAGVGGVSGVGDAAAATPGPEQGSRFPLILRNFNCGSIS